MYCSGNQGRKKSRDERESGRVRPSHRYRVRRRKASREPEVVWVTNDLDYAVEIVERLNSIAAESVAWVEQWSKALGCRRWERVLEPIDNQQSSQSVCDAQRLGSGDCVKAEVLMERTRRGGWKARLLSSDR